MEKLLAYLNDLSKTERAAFCAAIGTTEGYLRKAISTGRARHFKCELCVAIEMHSGGAVSRKDLREDWARVWPEMTYITIDLHRMQAGE
ncbi:helix-turn-helix domain-containing protein [Cupriavidus respiraculi]|uniref:TrfB transcriptional repressor protein domain-containing protein n=1 Tax=Cupriavidus respiraculi TaxID=195930 RepID=A0ABM8XV28_9BURK|nr:helix-turn-helix domain-containing protein [Cupriavidus respiraculi]CAG9184205.1 hypothetical protein LMG21510_05039 [Cupriavidus respiraculi]